MASIQHKVSVFDNSMEGSSKSGKDVNHNLIGKDWATSIQINDLKHNNHGVYQLTESKAVSWCVDRTGGIVPG